MPKSTTALIAFALLGLVACSPAFNWREVRIKDTDLVAMLPCKPDVGERLVPLGAKPVAMHMTGCDAGGATFAVAHASIGDASVVPAVLAQWRAAVLANMGATAAQDMSLRLTALGESTGARAVVSAQGKRRDGTVVMMQGVWFARGPEVYHAVVYADSVHGDITETFFPGLHFQ